MGLHREGLLAESRPRGSGAYELQRRRAPPGVLLVMLGRRSSETADLAQLERRLGDARDERAAAQADLGLAEAEERDLDGASVDDFLGTIAPGEYERCRHATAQRGTRSRTSTRTPSSGGAPSSPGPGSGTVCSATHVNYAPTSCHVSVAANGSAPTVGQRSRNSPSAGSS
jgi:hypothetical protein